MVEKVECFIEIVTNVNNQPALHRSKKELVWIKQTQKVAEG